MAGNVTRTHDAVRLSTRQRCMGLALALGKEASLKVSGLEQLGKAAAADESRQQLLFMFHRCSFSSRSSDIRQMETARKRCHTGKNIHANNILLPI